MGLMWGLQGRFPFQRRFSQPHAGSSPRPSVSGALAPGRARAVDRAREVPHSGQVQALPPPKGWSCLVWCLAQPRLHVATLPPSPRLVPRAAIRVCGPKQHAARVVTLTRPSGLWGRYSLWALEAVRGVRWQEYCRRRGGDRHGAPCGGGLRVAGGVYLGIISSVFTARLGNFLRISPSSVTSLPPSRTARCM